jgi:hypothetical protein
MKLLGRLRGQLTRVDAIKQFTVDLPLQTSIRGAADRIGRGS